MSGDDRHVVLGEVGALLASAAQSSEESAEGLLELPSAAGLARSTFRVAAALRDAGEQLARLAEETA